MVICCSGTDATPDQPCAPSSSPSAAIGVGASTFASVSDGQDVRLDRGTQGGCHVSLAVRAVGVPGQRMTVMYTIDDLETDERILTSRQDGRLRVVSDDPTACEAPGLRAILMMPWTVEDHRIRVTATMTDESSRTYTDSFEGVLRWPEAVQGVDRDLLCGPRD